MLHVHYTVNIRAPGIYKGTFFFQVAFTYSEVIWPWSGFLAVHLSVVSSASSFDGVAEGHVSLTIESPAQDGDAAPRISNIRFKICDIIYQPNPKMSNYFIRFFYFSGCQSGPK